MSIIAPEARAQASPTGGNTTTNTTTVNNNGDIVNVNAILNDDGTVNQNDSGNGQNANP